MPLKFTKANSEDLDQILHITRACVEFMRSKGIDQWDDVYPDEKTFNEDLSTGTLYVCKEDGKVVACGALNDFQDPEYAALSWKLQAQPIAVIHRLMASPTSQGSGVARLFAEYLEERARLLGYKTMRLDAFAKNPGALKFYQKLGYAQVGIVEFRKGQFWCFEKDLTVGKFLELRTERLTLRRLRTNDAESIAHYRSLPEIAQFQSSYSLSQAENWIQEMSDSGPATKGKWFQFGVQLTSENILIGDIGFLNTDENQKSWVGFTLNPHFWRQGFATEAVRAVLAYYKALGISNVWASTDPKNESSMRLLRTLGFKLVESKPEDRVFKL